MSIFVKNLIMETLFARSDQYIFQTPMNVVRKSIDDIDWTSRLIAIQGAKGVGKSTLMRQYIRKNYPAHSRKVLYCSLDSLYFSSHTITELVEQFRICGGEMIFLDEIHKYGDNWSRELKELNDLYNDIRIVISGSSLLKILNSDADLSRRCVRYTIQGLSFREYLDFYKNIKLPKHSLDEILSNPMSVADEVTAKCHPIEFFGDYLKFGYYPFYLEGAGTYYNRIEQVIGYTIEVELPELRLVDISGVRKLKKLVNIISDEVPFVLDASKLSSSLGATRETVVQYLHHLGRAKILNLLFSGSKDYAKLAKPDKLYLENPNMLYALCSRVPEIGTVRESFAVCMLVKDNAVEYGKAKGDFKVNGKYTFEIGGSDKGFSQVAGVQDSFVFADGIEMPMGRKLPLWMLGFLY